MTAMLSFENVNVAIADAPILRNVTFSLAPGVSAALIGRNGAGKTTTVRTIMGFTKASGTLRLFGEDLGSVPPHRRPSLGLGYAPEDRRLFSAFSVEENILLPGRVAKLNPEEMRRRLERAYSVLPELKELARRPAGSVSGGQGKMVALGRALMSNPRLLLCDEISLGLAPIVIRDIYARLPSIVTEGTSLVIVEQDIAQALAAADTVYCLQEGRVAFEGAARSATREAVAAAYFGI